MHFFQRTETRKKTLVFRRKASDDLVSPLDSKRISLGDSGNFRKVGVTSNSNEVKVSESNSAKLKVISNDASNEIKPKLGETNLGKDVLPEGDKHLSALGESTDGSSCEKDYCLSTSNDNDSNKNEGANAIVTSPLRGESSLESGISIEESAEDSDEEIEPKNYFGDLTSSQILSIDENVISNEKQIEATEEDAEKCNSNTTNIEKQGQIEGPEKEEVNIPSQLELNPTPDVDSNQVDQTSSDNSIGISNSPAGKKRQRCNRKKMTKNNPGSSQPANITSSRPQNISQQASKRGMVALLGDKPIGVNNTRLVTQQNITFNDVRQSQNFLQERKIAASNYRDTRIFEPQMTLNSMRGVPLVSQLNRPNDRIVRAALPQTQQLTQHTEYIPSRRFVFLLVLFFLTNRKIFDYSWETGLFEFSLAKKSWNKIESKSTILLSVRIEEVLNSSEKQSIKVSCNALTTFLFFLPVLIKGRQTQSRCARWLNYLLLRTYMRCS